MGTINSKVKILGSATILSGVLIYLLEDSSSTGVSGISNLGNTCFLNAILQALSACNTFITFLNSLRPLKGTEDSDSMVVSELEQFLKTLSTGKAQSPYELINALSQKFPYFGQQHDSHEIFYVINEALSAIKKRTDNSFLLEITKDNPLLGLMSTEITCTKCQNKTVNLETIFDISLIVSNSLFESFDNLSKSQYLDDFLCIRCSADASLTLASNSKNSFLSNIAKKYKSSKIEEEDLLRKVKTRALIRTVICKFPSLLCIHCKWLVAQGNILHKKKQHMEFPIQFEVPKGCYKLRAVVEHIGGGYAGHYFTYKVYEHSWYLCSDLEVRAVSIEQVLQAQAYMLFYELVCD